MPCPQPLYSWIEQVVTAFPNLSRPQATDLALYSIGSALAKRCGLNSVATILKPLLETSFATVRSRLQEFYQPSTVKSGTKRRQLEVTSCFAPLLAWVLKGWDEPHLALALDATSVGDRFTILSISVLYRGSAITVAWKVLQANVKHAWKPEWIALLETFQTKVPTGWTVIVMTDRGLYARWLFQKIVDLGWHPLMRITRKSKFRKESSHHSIPVTALVPKQGCRWEGRGIAFPNKAKRRLLCTVFARWDQGHAGPWILVSDMPPGLGKGVWYAMRSWIEQGFRLLKRGGWHLEATRMSAPERLERLWLVLAVATCYLLKVGGAVEERQMAVGTSGATDSGTGQSRGDDERAVPSRSRKRASGTKRRLVSVFCQGSSEFIGQLITGHGPPKPSGKPEPWLEFRGKIQN